MELGTWGQGDSGSVTIRSDEVILEGSYINGDVYGDGAVDENFEENWQSVTGVGPFISFETKNMSLGGVSSIDLTSTGAGDAGMLSIETDFPVIDEDIPDYVDRKGRLSGYEGFDGNFNNCKGWKRK